MLDPRPGERVGDLFCGLGNFTLPLASRGAHVVGIEGAPSLVARAAANARANGLESLATFFAHDLYADADRRARAAGAGATSSSSTRRATARWRSASRCRSRGLERIVYVSCSPSTLARDAGVLVNVKGYRLSAAGVVNMFPHTGHVESIALFVRGQTT